MVFSFVPPLQNGCKGFEVPRVRNQKSVPKAIGAAKAEGHAVLNARACKVGAEPVRCRQVRFRTSAGLEQRSSRTEERSSLAVADTRPRRIEAAGVAPPM